MKQIVAVLLISLGFYSFGIGFFISARSLERQKMATIRQLVYPEDNQRPLLRADPLERYPVGLFLLCAIGATTGFAGGLHLLLQVKTGKRKRLKSK